MNEELFNRWVREEERAWQEAFRELWTSFYDEALWIAKGDHQVCSDILQDAFYKIDRAIRAGRLQWQGESRFRALVLKSLSRRYFDYLRQQRRLTRRLPLFGVLGGETGESFEELRSSGRMTPDVEAEVKESVMVWIVGVLVPFYKKMRERGRNVLADVGEAMVAYILGKLGVEIRSAEVNEDELEGVISRMRGDELGFDRAECISFIQRKLKRDRNWVDVNLSRFKNQLQKYLDES